MPKRIERYQLKLESQSFILEALKGKQGCSLKEPNHAAAPHGLADGFRQ